MSYFQLMTHLNKQRLHNLANCTPIALQMKYVCRNLQESTRKHCGGFLPLFGGSHIKTCFYIRNKVQLDGISSLTADSQEVRRGRGEQIEENMKNIKSNSAHTAWKTPYTKPSSVLCERERERGGRTCCFSPLCGRPLLTDSERRVFAKCWELSFSH